MTNEQILINKVLSKAIKNGWKGSWQWYDMDTSIEEIIFSHSFAKALWGEKTDFCPQCEQKDIEIHGCISIMIPKWQYHIQQLSISKDRMAYLKEFI